MSQPNVISFSSTPQANDDIFYSSVTGITEDTTATYTFAVMVNDAGGKAKILWSLDDGNTSTDLLTQDTARTEALSSDYSLGGAHIWITSDGRVGYDTKTYSAAFQTFIQSLAVGQSTYDSFSYAIRLGDGTLSWAKAYVEIQGVNDGPVVDTTDLSGTVTEQIVPVGTLADSGTIDFTDVDLTDTHVISAITASAGALGTLTASVTTDTTGSGLGGVITWNYAVAASAVEYLAAGQTKIESFTLTLDDGNGGTVNRTIAVTITGTNDAPTASDTTMTVDEDTGLQPLNLLTLMNVQDVDYGSAVHVQSVTFVNGGMDVNPLVYTLAGDTLTFDPHQFEHLLAGQYAEPKLAVTFVDEYGATVTKILTVHVDGTATYDNPITGNSMDYHYIVSVSDGNTIDPTPAVINNTYSGNSESNTMFGDLNGITIQAIGVSATPPALTTGNDTLYGGGGTDIISGDADTLTIKVQGGTDTPANATATITMGEDNLYGGDGDDALYGDIRGMNSTVKGGMASTQDASATLVNSVFTFGNDNLTGGGGNDLLVGDLGALNGAGENIAEGGFTNLYTFSAIANGIFQGNTFIFGNDTLNGGRGDDILIGDADTMNTVVKGGSNPYARNYERGIIDSDRMTFGSDSLDGGDDNDFVFGDIQSLTMKVLDGYPDYVYSGFIHFGDDILNGGAGDDTLVGDVGIMIVDGYFVDIQPLFGADNLNGGDGNDFLCGDVRILNATVQNGSTFGLSFGADNLMGGSGSDELVGDVGTILNGAIQRIFFGADVLDGGADNDFLYGDVKTLTGPAAVLTFGADNLTGGLGSDELAGDVGSMSVQAIGGSTDINRTYAVSEISNTSSIFGADYLDGGADNDFLYGDVKTLTFGSQGGTAILGQADAFVWGTRLYFGEDTLIGGLGIDDLVGDVGTMTLNSMGGSALNEIVINVFGYRHSASAYVDGNGFIFGNDILDGGGDGDFLFGDVRVLTITSQGGISPSTLGDTHSLFSNAFTFGADTLDGGDGNDYFYGDAETLTITSRGGTSPFYSFYRSSDASSYFADNVFTFGADNLMGGSGNDELAGDVGAMTVTSIGGVGNGIYGYFTSFDPDSGDAIYHYNTFTFGADTLDGGAENDSLYGDVKNLSFILPQWGPTNEGFVNSGFFSSFQFSFGADNLTGGLGNDELSGDAQTLAITAQEAVPGGFSGGTFSTNILTFGADNLMGGLGADQLVGDVKDFSVNFPSGAADFQSNVFTFGNDTLDGGANDDVVCGDMMSFSMSSNPPLTLGMFVRNNVITLGNDVINGGGDNDTLYGDTVSFSMSFSFSSANSDKFVNNNVITFGNDVINGENGNDTLYGDMMSCSVSVFISDNPQAYNTFVYGNVITLGDDVLKGGDGNDTLYGDMPNAALLNIAAGFTVSGGNDTLQGGGGDDILDGGFGSNTADYSDGISEDLIVNLFLGSSSGGGLGNDILINIQNIRGSSFADTLIGDSQNNIIEGGAGADTITGGGGNDTLSYASSVGAVTVNLTTSTASGGDATGDIITDWPSFVNIIGGLGDDTLIGDSRNNILMCGDGNDLAQGGAGDDTFYGGAGTDKVVYAADFLSGGYSFNFVSPGVFQVISSATGTDTLSSVEQIQFGSTTYTVFLGTNDGDYIVHSGFGDGTGHDLILGFGGDDNISIPENTGDYILIGGDGVDTLQGGKGNNLLRGEAGDNVLIGGMGNDTVDYSSATSSITLNLGTYSAQNTGGAGKDTVLGFYGVSGIDNIMGGSGDDILTGDAKSNILNGGDGNDVLIGGTIDLASVITETEINSTTYFDAPLINRSSFGALAGSSAPTIEFSNPNFSSISIQGAINYVGDVDFYLIPVLNGQTITFDIDTPSGAYLLGEDTLLTLFNSHGSVIAFNDNGQAPGENGNPGNSYLTYTLPYNPDGFLDFVVIAVNLSGEFLTQGGAHAGNYQVANATGSYHLNIQVNIDDSDTLIGGNGNDTLNGGNGDDILDGGAGNDTADYTGAASAITLSLSSSAAQNTGGAGTDTIVFDSGTGLSTIENLTGGSGNDVLTGDSQNNNLIGNAGNDTLVGLAGDDSLDGGGGTDLAVFTGSILQYSFTTNGTQIFIADSVAGRNGSDTIFSIEQLQFGTQVYNRTTGGNNGNNTMTGTSGVDAVFGYDGNDTLNGSGGDDVLNGGIGTDSLTGGTGSDTMTGGAGADTFVIASAASPGTTGGSGNTGTLTGYDVITDFGDGADILDIQGTPVMAANTATPVNGNNSTLTINDVAVGSHSITNGIITFRTDTAPNTALSLTSLAHVAAAVQYLHNNDMGNAGVTMAFTATINGVAHTYIFEQVGATQSIANDILVDLQGVTFSTLVGLVGSTSTIRPAGVAGENIHLALADPTPDDLTDMVTVTVSGVPADWTLNAGVNHHDGSWTIQTMDPGALTITTAADFVGAKVLSVDISWTDIDGNTVVSHIGDNVEAYAPGSPIFAFSSVDDTLTGSAGADTFVFQQPITTINIYGFDTAADKIDLIGFAAQQFSELSIVNDAQGDAIITVGDGQTIEVQGVNASALTASHFQFNVMPHTVNAGTIDIGAGAAMPFGGTLENNGNIHVAGTLVMNGDVTGTGSITLSGSGALELNGSLDQLINFATGATATLKLDAGAQMNGILSGFGDDDVLDISGLLVGDATADNIDQYVHVVQSGNDTVLHIDHDGSGEGTDMSVVTLANTTTSLDALLASHSLDFTPDSLMIV